MPAAVAKCTVPKYLELIPEELDLRVFCHTIETVDGPAPCWSYVSDGLRRRGQREIVFTLRRGISDAEETFPRDPFDFFHLLYRQARDGKTVEAGGYSRFARSGGFLGRDGPVGMTYVNAVPMPGVNYPDRPLSAFLVRDEEIATIRAHGAYRLLSLLGLRDNFFPYPPWSDRTREPMLDAGDLARSLLGKHPVAPVRGLFVRRDRNQVIVHCANNGGSDNLAKRLATLPPAGPIVLITQPDPDAKSRLVWKPGMDVETISTDTRPDASITGGFIAFFISNAGDEGVHVCEDGFAALLRPANWAKVKDALLDDEPYSVPSKGNAMKLTIGLPTAADPVKQVGGHFYQDDALLRSRIKAEELTWFDRRVGHVVEDHFGDLPPADGEMLTLYCAIRPGQQAKFWTECQPDDLANGSQALLLRRLAALKPPQVSGPVAWAMKFELWGGTGDAKQFPHMPAVWNATPKNGTPIVLDDILVKAWPDK